MSRWLFRVTHACGRSLSAGATVLTYAAAATLCHRELREGIQGWWDAQYGSVPDGVVHFELSAIERDLYARFLRPRDRILLIGCGPGRDLGALIELGHRVEGLDVAPRCVELAATSLRRRGLVTTVHTGSVEDFTPSGLYDAFVFSSVVYGLIPQSRARVRVLQKLGASLAPAGRILVSYVEWSEPPRRLPSQIARGVARLLRSDWLPEYGDVFIVRTGPGPRQYRCHYSHAFGPGEFEREAREAGLAIVAREAPDGIFAVLEHGGRRASAAP